MDVQIDNVSNMPTNYDYMNSIGTNPWSLIFLSAVILVYYLIFATLGGGAQGGNEGVQSSVKSFIFLEVIIWGVFIALLLLNGLQYFFDIDVTASIKNYFSPQPEIDIAIDNLQPDDTKDDGVELSDKSEVFHVPGNTLVYEDAKALCDAYGARLATYDEIEDAYNKGAEWCSYGWSDNQLALFPTQKKTYDHLQTVEGHENDCGRTGVNGGFIANPAVRFGANCFGYKPKITSEEQDAMDSTSEYPKTRKDMAFERRVDYWRQKLPEVTVSPFNKSSWSKV